jgi:hypothetical protein
MHLLVLFVIGFVILVGTLAVVQVATPAPGVAWKVAYADYPELQELHEKFVGSCVVPNIPENWSENIAQNEVVQLMRKEAQEMSLSVLESKYALFETEAMAKSEWTSSIREFYSNKYMISHAVGSVDEIFSQTPVDVSEKKCQFVPRVEEFVPRLACYSRHVSEELENFAAQKIKQLMDRLQIPNSLKRLSDSRGASFMPAGGFMEAHTNRNHLAGWRFYMHYSPESKSVFYYRHPYDKSLHKIPDSNSGGNLFRIRKSPDALLWHSIVADAPRFSWGVYLPPELAQVLKANSVRV